MRTVVIFLLVLLTANLSSAADLGSTTMLVKKSIPVWSGAVETVRDGDNSGEDITNAIALGTVGEMPFLETGNTCNYLNDYEEACPFAGSTSPDVVYSFTPDIDVEISVDLCTGQYDTKVYIYDAQQNVVACNDDYYEAGDCFENSSFIGSVHLLGGSTYFIVVDGYGVDCGPYSLEVAEVAPAMECVVEVPAGAHVSEGEPVLDDSYVDNFNSGCASDGGMPPFQELMGHRDTGVLDFYGVSGWYGDPANPSRDTDWFTVVFNDMGEMTWTVTAEHRMTMYRLTEGDCNDIHVEDEATVLPCVPQTIHLLGEAGDVAWLWLGPDSYEPPAGFEGHEFDYRMEFSGMFGVAVEASTWGGIKAMYR